MSGAIAVTTAVVAIGVAAEMGTTFAIVAAVGATVGAIGAVTGVKELQYAGMALGAVGGIGALATGAGMFAGEAASFASEATDAGSWAGSVTAAAAPEGGYTMANLAESGLPGAATGFDASALPGAAAAAPTQAPSLDVINQVNGLPPGGNESIAPGSSGAMGGGDPTLPTQAPDVTPAAATDTGVSAPAQAAPDASSGTGNVTSAEPPASSLVNQNDPALMSTVTPQSPDVPAITGQPAGAPAGPITGTVAQPLPGQAVTGTVGTPNPLDAGIPGSYAAAQRAAGAAGSVPVGGQPSIWADIMKTIGQPGVAPLISGAVQAGGAFIAGATSTLTPAQIRALNAQAEANTAATNLANQNAALAANQLKNFTGPMPVAYRKPDQMPGLVNQPPPITGAPAQ